ncbi:MAG: hypothetical protein M0R18_13475, partial [Deltaproteobacteria bacterium]|nr:hypothetical protein [Deltaproteobacteria bacterium]
RLPPPLKINDRQPGMGQARSLRDVKTKTVRPPMPHGINHPFEHGSLGMSVGTDSEYSGNAAHMEMISIC